MKRLLLGMALPLMLGIGGCTFRTHPTDMQNLPGGDRMAKGPGLLDRHSPYASDNGLVVYSSNPSQPSLVGPGRAKAPPAVPRTVPPLAATAAPAAPIPAAPMPASGYEQFREFQAYQRFMSLPSDSPERIQFQQWLEWQYYQRWKAEHGQ